MKSKWTRTELNLPIVNVTKTLLYGTNQRRNKQYEARKPHQLCKQRMGVMWKGGVLVNSPHDNIWVEIDNHYKGSVCLLYTSDAADE